MQSGLEGLIGNTPLVRLERLFPDRPGFIYGKMEMLNPGGSMKDRPAFNIIKSAVDAGDIKPGGTVIESSSGNMGIGLAQACRYFGLNFICVVDPRANGQNIAIMRAFGARIETVEDKGTYDSLLAARISRVHELLQRTPGAFWSNQYENMHNPDAYASMMDEIVTDIGSMDVLFCATGTCGTLRGCTDYIAKHNLPTKVMAVDARGSVIFGGQAGERLIPGHGSSITPPLLQPGSATKVFRVSDAESVEGCRMLFDRESIMAGGSTGAIVHALQSWQKNITTKMKVVIIIGDRGEHYLDTIYNDAWVAQKLHPVKGGQYERI